MNCLSLWQPACVLANLPQGQLWSLSHIVLDQVNYVPGTKDWACNMVPQSPYPTIGKITLEVKPVQLGLSEDGVRAPGRLPGSHRCISSSGGQAEEEKQTDLQVLGSCLMSR